MLLANEFHLSMFEIRVSGQVIKEVMDTLIDCTVENSIHLPDMCAIHVEDTQFHWIDADTFKVGAPIEVMGGGEKDGALRSLFKGEITGVEMDLAAHGVPSMIVRCFDRRHRLHRGRKIKTFQNVKDSDVVQQIGSAAGFAVHADQTKQVHDWLLQNNQTDWEFLTERAERCGYRLFLKNEKDLYFQPVKDSGDDVIELEWGESLRSFRPRISATPQVNQVVVRGWDPQEKVAIIGNYEKPSGIPQIGNGQSGGAVAQGAFGDAKMVVVDHPITTQSEAETLARSICDDIGGEYLEAEGLCNGQPKLKPGAMVEIKNIGNRFSGKYYVTSTTHTYTPAEGYATLFTVNGKSPSTLLAMLEPMGSAERAPLGGNIVVGIVTNNKDDKNLGRVKVKYPWLSDSEESFWVRQTAPMAGPERGFYFLPEVNDEVLIAFEHGDVTRPYIIGSLWNGKDKPIEPNSAAVGGDGKVNHRIIKTRIGHTLLFDDLDGTGEIKFTTAKGHVVTMNDKEEHITATSTKGHMLTLHDKDKHITAKTTSGHKVFLDDAGSQIIVVDKTGSNKMTISSNDNSIKIECMGDFTIDAKGKVSIQGMAGVDVKTPAMMNLESDGPGSLKSSSILEIKGILVQINS